MVIPNRNHEDERMENKEINRMRKAMLQLQPLIHKGSWGDESSRSFATYLCEDVVQCLKTFSSSPMTPNCNGLDRLEVKSPRISTKLKPRFDGDAVKELILSDLNDDFKWRKNGKKYNKASQKDRTYYRCAKSGCDGARYAEATTNPSGTPQYKVTCYRNHTCNPAVLTTEAGRSAVLTTEAGRSVLTTEARRSAVLTTEAGPSAVPTTEAGPSAVPTDLILASSYISPNVGLSIDTPQILFDDSDWGIPPRVGLSNDTQILFEGFCADSPLMIPNCFMETPTFEENLQFRRPVAPHQFFC